MPGYCLLLVVESEWNNNDFLIKWEAGFKWTCKRVNKTKVDELAFYASSFSI